MSATQPLSPSTGLKTRLLITASMACMISSHIFSSNAFAQVVINSDITTPLSTSTADDGAPADVFIGALGAEDGGITPETGDLPALTLDSDNNVTIETNGELVFVAEDAAQFEDVVGLEIQTGNSGEVAINGIIAAVEEFNIGTNDDGLFEGVFAEGLGRTGVLISGSGAFAGNITTADTSQIEIQGNDSFGVLLRDTASVVGGINLDGVINATGANSTAVSLQGDTVGDVTISAAIQSQGENNSSVRIDGDIDGAFVYQGDISNTAYTNPFRPPEFFRDLLTDEDRLQADSALIIGGDISGGVHLALDETVNDEGVVTATRTPTISQLGEAPAVLVQGADGAPIMIGLVGTNDPDSDPSEQFGFINEAIITSSSLFDDLGATGVSFENATIAGGISNTGIISTTNNRDGGDDAAQSVAVRIGDGVTSGVFNNGGSILASAIESTDVFTDLNDIPDANDVLATALSIEGSANIAELTNTGDITASISGREGGAFALVDQSGNLAMITNEGTISASGFNSDPNADADFVPEFTLVAIDVSANTSGVTFTQQQTFDPTPDDDIDPISPSLTGDILFGSGDDIFSSAAGTITGGVDFNDGNDRFDLADTFFIGNITNSSGDLDITLSENSTLQPTQTGTLNISSLTVDDTSTLFSIIDASSDTAETSLISATGDITLQDGATLTPVLVNIIDDEEDEFGATIQTTSYVLLEANNLTIDGGVESLQLETTPFLYDVDLSQEDQTLIADLTLRDASVLGLDNAQLGDENEVYNAVLGSLRNNDDLGSAFTSITEQEDFISAYNQVLPEFSAAATQFVGANIDGATGSVSSHLNNARLSDQQPGSAWIEEFGYYGEREQVNLSEGYTGYGFGFTGGIDTAFGPFHTVGINLGFAASEIEDDIGFDDPLNVETFQAGLYAGYALGALSIDGYIGGGLSNFESSRNVEIGNFNQSVFGDWDGTHYNGSLNVGYDVNLGSKYFLRPTVNVSYVSLTEDAYEETGSGAFNLAIEERDSELGHASALLNFGGFWEDDRKWWRPSMRLGARTEFTDSNTSTVAAFLSGGDTLDFFTLTGEEFPNEALLFGLSFAMGTKFSSFSIDYDADLRDDYSLHTARLVLRMLF